ATPEDVGLSSEGLARVDAAVQRLIDRGVLAGAVTLVGRHGRVAHTNAMGQKDMASGEPLAVDTMFRIFSMTKPVTGAAMMILHDRGLWAPDNPIAKLYRDAEVWQSGSLAEMAARVGKLPLAYQPGSKWLYSLSMDIQGAI